MNIIPGMYVYKKMEGFQLVPFPRKLLLGALETSRFCGSRKSAARSSSAPIMPCSRCCTYIPATLGDSVPVMPSWCWTWKELQYESIPIHFFMLNYIFSRHDLDAKAEADYLGDSPAQSPEFLQSPVFSYRSVWEADPVPGEERLCCAQPGTGPPRHSLQDISRSVKPRPCLVGLWEM